MTSQRESRDNTLASMKTNEASVDQLRQHPARPETQYLRERQLLAEILPFSHATLWRMVAAGKFPRPIKLTERVTAWRSSEVHEWLDAQATA